MHIAHSCEGYEDRNERTFARSVGERIAVKLAEIAIGSHELCSVTRTAIVSVTIAEGSSCAWLGYRKAGWVSGRGDVRHMSQFKVHWNKSKLSMNCAGGIDTFTISVSHSSEIWSKRTISPFS